MRLRSYAICPWCRQRIQITKDGEGAFFCQMCGCSFRHNFIKWGVCLPAVIAVLAVAFVLLREYLVHMAGASISLILSLTYFIPDYRIVSYGVIEPYEARQVAEEYEVFDEKESKWFIAVLVLLLAAIAVYFVYAMKS